VLKCIASVLPDSGLRNWTEELLSFVVIQVPVALEYIQSGIENGVGQICSLLCTPYSTTYNRDIQDKGG